MVDAVLPASIRLDIPEMDVEHLLQVQLLGAIGDALIATDRREAYDLVRQLEDVASAHFLGEQLLMRLHAYPGYGEHVRAHDRLIEELRILEEKIVTGLMDAATSTHALELWLVHHIHTFDRAFAIFVQGRQRKTGPSLESDT